MFDTAKAPGQQRRLVIADEGIGPTVVDSLWRLFDHAFDITRSLAAL